MYQKYTKRWFDVTLAITLLVITLPISILVALLIRTESSGPIFFKQMRTGINGKNFLMYKFRSMLHDNDVRDLTKKNQITKLGKILRTFSLDEIPQVINVLRGEMSFIGPRPWIPEYFKYMNPNQRKRTAVLPGITGLAQVYGRNSLTINEKINYDLKYVETISFRQDIKTTALTLKAIFDKAAQEIDKGGIGDELMTLRSQIAETLTVDPAQTVFYSSIIQQKPGANGSTASRIRRKRQTGIPAGYEKL